MRSSAIYWRMSTIDLKPGSSKGVTQREGASVLWLCTFLDSRLGIGKSVLNYTKIPGKVERETNLRFDVVLFVEKNLVTRNICNRTAIRHR